MEFFEVGELRLALVSCRVDDEPGGRVRLTRAEREVVALIRLGLSNAEIAARRGTALRTVANQIAAILRKHGVGSRHELVAATCSEQDRGE